MATAYAQYGSGTNQASSVSQLPIRTTTPEQDQYAVGWLSALGGGVQERKASVASAQIARQFSAEEARKVREFQEMLSSSAYQRAVADMRKAGINPALMYGGAKPASTPGGAQGQTVQAQQSSSAGQLVSLIGTIGSVILGGMKLATSAAKVGASSADNILKTTGSMKFLKALKHEEKTGKVPDWYTYGT